MMSVWVFSLVPGQPCSGEAAFDEARLTPESSGLKIFNGGHYRRSEDGRLKGSRGTLSAHRARGRCR
jgi:hypothetical protein